MSRLSLVITNDEAKPRQAQIGILDFIWWLALSWMSF